MTDRTIVHMDLDTFFVSCERLTNSKFNGIPLIIGGGDRGVVASCSYEARAFGVRSAMPIKKALYLCPEATVVKGDMELYSRQSKLVTEIIGEKAPVMEKASIDEFYLDISGMDKFFGCYSWASELSQTIIKESGLPISFGLSTNKTVSKIATGEGKPIGKIEVQPQLIRNFLNPLSIDKIPMLGSTTSELLTRIGIRRIKTLAEMPVDMLQKLLGKNGKMLWKKANGIDESPVEPYRERKSISREMTFVQDIMDIYAIKAVLVHMVEDLAYQLRKEQWITSVVTVKIRYSNFNTETKQVTINYSSCDHTLMKTVEMLFVKLYTKRMRIRLVGVNFGGLIRGSHQVNLFEDVPKMLSLYKAMDKIKDRYGENSIRRSVGVNSKDNLRLCS